MEEAQVQETKQFTETIGHLRQVYPEDKMKDISVSFCFICLLHLANEKGLEIQPDQQSDMTELIIRQT